VPVGLFLQAKSPPLAFILIDGNYQFLETGGLGLDYGQDLPSDVLGEAFGCRIVDRQETAILDWENPATIFESRLDFSTVF
jgi:hypothetical protein